MFNNKKKPVAWFVSNCYTRSNRNKLVADIQKHIDVDIYGNCVNISNPQINFIQRSQKFTELLNSTYKFIFTFDDSL